MSNQDSSYKTVILTREGSTAVLTLNRPEVFNAWNGDMHSEVSVVLDEIEHDSAIRVLIITGAGKGFSSGADVSQDFTQIGKTTATETVIGRAILGQPNLVWVVEKLANLSKPVIAAINGAAVGAGFSFALACDMRIASEKARFSIAFVQRGLIPDAGATYFLPRLIGLGRASEFVFTGDMIDANAAEKLGVVDRVVAHEELMNAAMKIAGKIANCPPLAIKLTKKALRQGLVEPNLASHLHYEICVNNFLMATEDFKESVDSFVAKRQPDFKGR